VIADLGINIPFVKGRAVNINNCWHFCTDGNDVEAMFFDEDDFINGMNRIYFISRSFRCIILAFVLMDTHVHFVLYGDYEECRRFFHEYVRRTSQYLSEKCRGRKLFKRVHISFQQVDTDLYLKTVICYVLKNAPVAGLPFSAHDYPWSSASLYFRKAGLWTSPRWVDLEESDIPGIRAQRSLFKTKESVNVRLKTFGPLILPEEYVDYQLVEACFRTQRAFNFFMSTPKETEVESRGGTLSSLSLPIQEMRCHRNDTCTELFGTKSVSDLDTAQRIMLVKTLRARFRCSPKQLARICGLKYEEVAEIL